MKPIILTCTAAATLLVGCESTVIKLNRGTEPLAGRRACETFARGTEQEASVWSVAGYATGVAGAAAIAIGSVIGESTDTDANWAETHRNLLVTAAGGVLLFTARSLFKSSDASAAASSLATRQLANPDDADAFKSCVDARAAWIDARRDSNAILGSVVDDQAKKLAGQQKEIEGQRKQIESLEKTVNQLKPEK